MLSGGGGGGGWCVLSGVVPLSGGGGGGWRVLSGGTLPVSGGGDATAVSTTATTAESLIPSALAKMVTRPSPTPCTRPVSPTVAMC